MEHSAIRKTKAQIKNCIVVEVKGKNGKRIEREKLKLNIRFDNTQDRFTTCFKTCGKNSWVFPKGFKKGSFSKSFKMVQKLFKSKLYTGEFTYLFRWCILGVDFCQIIVIRYLCMQRGIQEPIGVLHVMK